MKIINDFEETPQKPVALTLGNFDGVHLGHQYLMYRATTLAEELGCLSAVCTFDPHPFHFYGKSLKLISTAEERLKWIRDCGIDICFWTTFDSSISRLLPETFMEEYILYKMNAKAVIVGDNFRFGYNRLGDVHLLAAFCKKHNLACEIVTPLPMGGETISSSRVREAIANKDYDLAELLLGHPVPPSSRQ